MALTLIDRFTSDFDHAKYEDKYRERLLKIVKQKSRGEEIHAPARERKRRSRPPRGAPGERRRGERARRTGGRSRGGPKRRRPATSGSARSAQSRRSSFGRIDVTARSAASRSRRPSRGCSAPVRRSSRFGELVAQRVLPFEQSCLLLLCSVGPDDFFGRFDGAGVIPANDENPTVSSSSVSAPRTSASRASSSAIAFRSRSRTRRRTRRSDLSSRSDVRDGDLGEQIERRVSSAALS